MTRRTFRQVACPVCYSQDYRSLGIVPISSGFREALGNEVGIPETIVACCKLCGLYYVQPMPFPTPEQYDRLYAADYFPENTPRWEQRRCEDAERRLQLITDSLGGDGELLDIGCGQGRMLSIARVHGWKCRGLEVSRPMAEAAKNTSGVPVDVGHLESIGYKECRFAAIYSDSVLEHVPTPGDFVQEIARILQPGGVAYIVVPNEDGLFSRIRGILRRLKGYNQRLTPFASPYHWIGFKKRILPKLCVGA